MSRAPLHPGQWLYCPARRRLLHLMWRVTEEEWSCDLYDLGGILPVAADHCSDLELCLLLPVWKRQFRPN